MDIYYYPVTKGEAQEIPLEELKELRKLGCEQEVPRNAVAVDISGGGLRFISDEPGERGDYVLMLIDLKGQETTHHLEILGETFRMPLDHPCKHLLPEMYHLK